MPTRRTTLLLLIAVLFGCGRLEQVSVPSAAQGVSGTVLWRPGYDASDAWYLLHPPDSTPRPQPDALVHLLQYAESSVLAEDILAEAQTDQQGRYRIRAVPGLYRIVVHVPNKNVPVLSMVDPDFHVDFEVNALKTITIGKGVFSTHDFEIAELVAQ